MVVLGLGDGLLCSFLSVSAYGLQLGSAQTPFDPCLLVMFGDGKLRGVRGVSRGDGEGTATFQEKCRQLQDRFSFGKWGQRGGRYCGKVLRQLPDCTAEDGQAYFVDSLVLVPVSEQRRKDLMAEVTEEELAEASSQIWNLSYYA